jgi:hypothetical protein
MERGIRFPHDCTIARATAAPVNPRKAIIGAVSFGVIPTSIDIVSPAIALASLTPKGKPAPPNVQNNPSVPYIKDQAAAAYATHAGHLLHQLFI